jgi:hypothetical protein
MNQILSKEICKKLLLEKCRITSKNNSYKFTSGSEYYYTNTPNLKQSIEFYTSFLPNNIDYKIKCYHILYNIYYIPKCKFCKNNSHFSFKYFKYDDTCFSNNCKSKTKKNIKKRAENFFNNFKEDFSNLYSIEEIKKISKNKIFNEQHQFIIFKAYELYKNQKLLNSLLYYTKHLIPINYENILNTKILRERVYIIYFNLKEIPKCELSTCNNKTIFQSITIGYSKYCSQKCVHKSFSKKRETVIPTKINSKEECKKLFITECSIIKQDNNKFKATKSSSSLYLAEKNKYIKNTIEKYTLFLPLDISIAERWYFFLYNIKEIPYCFCGKKCSFITLEKGYGLGCSKNHSLIVKKKIIKKYIRNFKEDFSIILSLPEIKKIYNTLFQQKVYSIFSASGIYNNKIFINSLLYYTYYLIPINYNDIENKSILKERLYIIINNIKEIPICNHPNCNNRCNFKGLNHGYYEYCSLKCMSNSPKIKEKHKKTCNEKWGVDYYFQTKKSKEDNSKLFGDTTKLFGRKNHPIANNVLYQSIPELEFINLWLEHYSPETIRNGKSIKYMFNNRIRRYYPDFIIIYPDNSKEIIEIKGTHPYFFRNLKDGSLFAKWDAAEKYAKENGYKSYTFILNGEIKTKEDIKREFFKYLS